MKIVLDNIVFSLQKIGGISILWGELIKKMNGADVSFLEYNRSNDNIIRRKIKINSDDIINAEKQNKVFLTRYINPYISDIQDKFIFISSYYRTCRNKNAFNVTIVHDFTYEYYFKGLAKKIHFIQKKKAVENSDLIICISHNTKKDLLKFFPNIEEKKINVVYNGVSEVYNRINIDKDFSIISPNLYYLNSKKNILFVGQRGGYKNFDKVVEAFTVLDENYHLLIVGIPFNNDEIKLIKKFNLKEGSYTILENISMENLNLVYNFADVLVYPSSYEGFGIPIVEAMKTGLPVIAYNSSSIPEVLGNAGVLLDYLTPNHILSAIKSLEDINFRDEIVKKGFKQASLFSWDKTFNQYFHLFQKLYNTKRL